MRLFLFLSVFQYLVTTTTTEACSDILVTPAASSDGAAMIAYNADDVSLYGVLYHYPAAHGQAGKSRSIYEWDTGVSFCLVLFFSFVE